MSEWIFKGFYGKFYLKFLEMSVAEWQLKKKIKKSIKN